MSRIYTSTTESYTTAKQFNILRTNKDGMHWQVQVSERDYANVKSGDDDFHKDSGEFTFFVAPETLTEEFDILGFYDLQPTGQKTTIGQVFALVQSLYMNQAAKRDALENIAVEPESGDAPISDNLN